MALTQNQLALQMLAQLRILDPSVSAEVGTPERKILDTVAQALSDSQVDLTQLSGALDVDAKYGTSLDNFLALFGFGRQKAVQATGFVTFHRDVPSTLDIRIPAGSQMMIPPEEIAVDETGHFTNPVYETTFEVTLPAGALSVVAPVRAVVAGTIGNLEAGRVLQFVGNPVYGIASSTGGITNEAPITGGVDREDDDQLKTRFKNTVFRNLAGTQDQYMALAVSTAFTTKVNVIGPISRYREYIQVPDLDDSQSYEIDPQPNNSLLETGAGNVGEWTTALSTIPYSKHTYDTVPSFVSNGKTGTQTVFYRDEIDWRLNVSSIAKNRGDAYRQAHAQFPQDEDPLTADNRPNITFLNVYNPTGPDDPNVVAVRPKDVVLFEHSYLSSVSRNDYDHGVANAVDVFIDGSNNTVASTVITSPGTSTTTAFVTTPTSKYFRENYRRVGEPDVFPQTGNLFIPLFWQPVVQLPQEIIVATETESATFTLGTHYWPVEDITEYYGTVRARNGIEWDASALDTTSTLALEDFPAGTSINIDNYLFDKNIVDLQAMLEAQKQVTTDVLVHRARVRYFKLDVTVMYTPGYNTTLVNEQMRAAVVRFLGVQYFGNVIQLSDLLSVLHSVPGVDNVRWSTDVPHSSDVVRILETNANGTTRPDPLNPTAKRTYDNDFFLSDDELPALATAVDIDGFGTEDSDTTRADRREFAVQPGLIIRTRAQNTWIKSG